MKQSPNYYAPELTFISALVLLITLFGCTTSSLSKTKVDKDTYPQNASSSALPISQANTSDKELNQSTADVQSVRRRADELYEKGDYLAAEPLYQRLMLVESLKPAELIGIANNLGEFYSRRGQYEQAEYCYKAAHDCAKLAFGANHRETGIAAFKLGEFCINHGLYRAIDSVFNESYAILKKSRHNESSDLPALNMVAYMVFLSGDRNGAKELYNSVVKAGLSKQGEERLAAADAMSRLAGMHLECDHQSKIQKCQSESLHKKALEVYETVLGANDIRVAEKLDALGLYYYNDARDNAHAEKCYAQSLEIRKKKLCDFSRDIGTNCYWLGRCKLSLGKKAEAWPLIERYNNNRLKFVLPGSHEQARGDLDYASFLKAYGRLSEAQYFLRRADLIRSIAYAYPPVLKLKP